MITCNECGREFKDNRGLRLHRCQTRNDKGEQMEKTSKKEINQTDPVKSTVLTPEQKGIADRVASEDTSWFTIREDELLDYSLQNDPLSIQNCCPPAFKLEFKEKRYHFRWCERKPERIDQLTKSVRPPFRYALVTRTTLPELEDFVDPILGCVTNLDQALLFQPYAHHQMVMEGKRQQNDAKANSSGMNAFRDKRHSDGNVEITIGKEHAINLARDEVHYEDTREDNDLGGLVLDE